MRNRNQNNWASSIWLDTLAKIIANGKEVCPRGKPTLELQHHAIIVNMLHPVVLCPARKLSYTFLAAEALWILDGDNLVETIAPYNPNIAKFSDDGKVFFGAYGPRIMSQFEYVVQKLVEDADTRQAVLTIWRENPPQTKDVPCTVAIAFSIRQFRLNCHVFMRSSDAWLGLPYDVFNFSMLALKVACAYNQRVVQGKLDLGWLYLTMASSHLYMENREQAMDCVDEWNPLPGDEVPSMSLLGGDWNFYREQLIACRDKTDSLWRIRL